MQCWFIIENGELQEKLIKHLKKESAVLEVLNDLLTSPGPISMKSALQRLNYPEELCTVWKMHCSKDEFKCSSDEILSAIKELYRQCDTKSPLSNDVCLTTLQKIQGAEMNCFDSQLVSVFQFADFFSRNYNLTAYFQAAFKEVRVMKALTSTDDLVLLSVLQDRKIIPMVSSCLKKLAEHIQSKNRTVQRLIVEFYTKLALENKEKAIDIYLELLESTELSTRIAACAALKCLEALKARDQIAYLWQNDEVEVRNAAFEALKVVGFPEGMEPSKDAKLGFTEVSTRL